MMKHYPTPRKMNSRPDFQQEEPSSSFPRIINPVKIFHQKSGIPKTCSPWLVHGLFLLSQYDGWMDVCKDIFEDYTRMSLSTSTRRITTEAMRVLIPQHWIILSDTYLDALTPQDISNIMKKDTSIKTFIDTLFQGALAPEEVSKEAQKNRELLRTGIKLYLAVYLPGEITDYVNATIHQKHEKGNQGVSLQTLKTMGSMALTYADDRSTPDKPPVQTLCLLMTTMMRRVGVLR